MKYCGVDFENKYYELGEPPNYSRKNWNDEKYTLGLDFPNLPYFIDGDVNITETFAIHRYIAEKWKPELCGTNPADRARITMVSKLLNDFKLGVNMPCYKGNKE